MQLFPSLRLVAVCLLAVSSAIHASESEPPISEEAFWEDVPTVMSASRIAQPVIDAPVAVTVIDRRMIDASGAREIPELFRLVPGMIVGYHDGHTPSVSYHMSKDRYARRMQVLIDGRSVYTTAIGGIPWATLPITMDDIDRIEVVRGPNSVSYGANSFLGVINIITREAVLDRGTSVKTNLGSQGVRELFVRHGGGSAKFDYRFNVGLTSDDGFDNRNDYKRSAIASFRGDYTINSRDLLTFDLGVGAGPRGVENRIITPSEIGPNREKDVLNHQQHIKWERSLGAGESISIQFYHIFHRNTETFWTEDFIYTSLGDADLVVEPMYVDFSRETHRYNLELQNNLNFSDSVRGVWGIGYRDDQVWAAENLMANEEIHNHLKFAYLNLEWNPAAAWLVNAGVMLEDYSTTGTSVSPRAGVNYRFTPAHSMRLTASQAIRTPSMYEYAGRYGYAGQTNWYSGSTLVAPGPYLDEVFEQGTRETTVEEMTSVELGYHGMPMRGRVELDFKVYRDYLDDLIGFSEGILINRENEFEIRGAELETKFTLVDNSSLYFAYAYTDINEKVIHDGVYHMDERSRAAPRHAFSLLYMMDFDKNITAGIGFYFTDRIQGWDSGSNEKVRDQVRRLDLKVARKFVWSGVDTELALSARNILGNYEEMEVLRPKADYDYLNVVGSSAYVTIKLAVD